MSPPRILEHTATPGLRGEFCWDLSLEGDWANLLTEIVRRRPKIVFPEPPLHLVLQAFELQLEPHPCAYSRATSGGIDGLLRVQTPDHAHPAARWPDFRPGAPTHSDVGETPTCRSRMRCAGFLAQFLLISTSVCSALCRTSIVCT